MLINKTVPSFVYRHVIPNLKAQDWKNVPLPTVLFYLFIFLAELKQVTL